MLTKKSSYALVLTGIVTLTTGFYFATDTAVAAPTLATVPVVHEENQPVESTEPAASGEILSDGPNQDSVATPTPPVAAVAPIQNQKPDNDTAPTTPASLSIPSIKLNAPIIQVGLNAKGEMDVPDGTTNNVGWYKNGPVPGAEGSAVLDAHVFAALKNLRYAKVGDSVYVKDAAGTTRHFVIRSSMVYEVASVPRELLFNRSGGKYLNIITCAGKFVPSMDTYDHRLVVYAELVDN